MQFLHLLNIILEVDLKCLLEFPKDHPILIYKSFVLINRTNSFNLVIEFIIKNIFNFKKECLAVEARAKMIEQVAVMD